MPTPSPRPHQPQTRKLHAVPNRLTGLAYATVTKDEAHWCLAVQQNATHDVTGGTIPRSANETDAQLSSKATLKAIETAMNLAGSGTAQLYVYDHDVRSAIAGLDIPQLALAPRIPEGALEAAVQHTAQLAGAPLTAVKMLMPSKVRTWAQRDALRALNERSKEPVMVSSDASMGRRTKDAGLGWIIDWPETNPTCGATSVKAANILTAELLAIELAVKEVLKTVSSGREVRFHSDSQIAIAGIEALHDGLVPDRMTSAQIGIAERINQLRKQYNFTFSWVKGHNGDALNEAADRLAVTARRCKEAQVAPDLRQAMFTNISESVHLPLAS